MNSSVRLILPKLSAVLTVMDTLPLTVAPSAGLVILSVGGIISLTGDLVPAMLAEEFVLGKEFLDGLFELAGELGLAVEDLALA